MTSLQVLENLCVTKIYVKAKKTVVFYKKVENFLYLMCPLFSVLSVTFFKIYLFEKMEHFLQWSKYFHFKIQGDLFSCMKRAVLYFYFFEMRRELDSRKKILTFFKKWKLVLNRWCRGPESATGNRRRNCPSTYETTKVSCYMYIIGDWSIPLWP